MFLFHHVDPIDELLRIANCTGNDGLTVFHHCAWTLPQLLMSIWSRAQARARLARGVPFVLLKGSLIMIYEDVIRTTIRTRLVELARIAADKHDCAKVATVPDG